MHTDAPTSSRTLIIVALIFSTIWLATLGGRKLLNPDEGRYAEIPREMVAMGNWLTPRLNDLKYFEKPALQYWATAVAYETLGTNDFTSRLWCGLTGLAGVFFAGWAGVRLFGRNTGIIAAALLGSSFFWVLQGHINTLDMGLSFFVEVALLGFLLAQQAAEKSKSERNWMFVVWVATALGFLSKGIVAAALPVLTLVVYTAVEREFSAWRRLHIIGGLALFLIITAPWFIAVSIANPEFLFFFFVHEHFQRFLTDVHERVEPAWFFIPFLIIGSLPWLAIAVQSVGQQWRADTLSTGFRPRRFLMLWIVAIMVFFSASHSKLIPYILPVMPALALVAADFIARTRSEIIRRHLIGIALFWLAALGYLCFAPLPLPTDSKTPTEVFASLFHFAQIGTALALLGALAAWWIAKNRDGVRDAMLCSSMGAFLALSALLVGLDAARETKSGFDLAQQIKPQHDSSKPFYSVNDYDQTLPFYLERTMTLVGYRGELDFGLNQEPHKGLPDTAAFVKAWSNDPSGSMSVMPHATYAALAAAQVPMTVIGRNIDLIAVKKP